MLKVKFNSSAKLVNEDTRTITPSFRFIKSVTDATIVGYYNLLKVIVDNRLGELEGKLADVLTKSRVKNLPAEELNKLKKNEVILNKKIGEINNLIDLDIFKQKESLKEKYISFSDLEQMLGGKPTSILTPNMKITFAALPVETLIEFMLASPQALTMLKKRITPAYAKEKLIEYFNERSLTHLNLAIKLTEEWEGLYDPNSFTVFVSIPPSYFNNIVTTDEEGNTIQSPGKLFNLGTMKSYNANSFADEIKDRMETIKESIPHELRHVIQDIYGKIFNAKLTGLAKVSSFRNKPYDMYGRAINPKTKELLRDPKTGKPIMWQDEYGKELPHHMMPVEVATDVQDELERFARKFKEDLSNIIKHKKDPKIAELRNNIKLIHEIVRELYKAYIGSDPTAPLAKQYGFQPILYRSKVINSYKKENRDLYKWAVNVGYNFIENDMYVSLFNHIMS